MSQKKTCFTLALSSLLRFEWAFGTLFSLVSSSRFAYTDTRLLSRLRSTNTYACISISFAYGENGDCARCLSYTPFLVVALPQKKNGHRRPCERDIKERKKTGKWVGIFHTHWFNTEDLIATIINRVCPPHTQTILLKIKKNIIFFQIPTNKTIVKKNIWSPNTSQTTCVGWQVSKHMHSTIEVKRRSIEVHGVNRTPFRCWHIFFWCVLSVWPRFFLSMCERVFFVIEYKL